MEVWVLPCLSPMYVLMGVYAVCILHCVYRYMYDEWRTCVCTLSQSQSVYTRFRRQPDNNTSLEKAKHRQLLVTTNEAAGSD